MPQGAFAEVAIGTGIFPAIFGGGDNCALRLDGTVVCWGPGDLDNTPTDLFSSIAVGSAHACGLKLDGTLVCWGSGPIFTNGLPSPAETFKSVSAGTWMTCAIRTDDSLYCWGYDDLFPRGIAGLLPAGAYTQVDVSENFACAVRSDNKIVCWGRWGESWCLDLLFCDASGRCEPSREVECPRAAVLDQDGFVGVATGSYYACGVNLAGGVFCWEMLSLDDRDDECRRLRIPPPGGDVVEIAARGQACGLRTDGSVQCW
ncbi:MAG: hypothetical protein HYZ27_08060 [Deltaproteobacteria bacterium]|nr:hypothetical protein [Deltaproteobacteria bacterium]